MIIGSGYCCIAQLSNTSVKIDHIYVETHVRLQFMLSQGYKNSRHTFKTIITKIKSITKTNDIIIYPYCNENQQ